MNRLQKLALWVWILVLLGGCALPKKEWVPPLNVAELPASRPTSRPSEEPAVELVSWASIKEELAKIPDEELLKESLRGRLTWYDPYLAEDVPKDMGDAIRKEYVSRHPEKSEKVRQWILEERFAKGMTLLDLRFVFFGNGTWKMFSKDSDGREMWIFRYPGSFKAYYFHLRRGVVTSWEFLNLDD